MATAVQAAVAAPGSAEYVSTKLGRRGQGCSHFPRYVPDDASQQKYPSRLGFFHATSAEARISFLDTHRLCRACLDLSAPEGYNFWSGLASPPEAGWLTKATPSKENYPALFQAGTEGFSQAGPRSRQVSNATASQSRIIAIPQVAQAREAWEWINKEKKPFYIDQLHLDGGSLPLAERKAEADAIIAKMFGMPFSESQALKAEKKKKKVVTEPKPSVPRPNIEPAANEGVVAPSKPERRLKKSANDLGASPPITQVNAHNITFSNSILQPSTAPAGPSATPKIARKAIPTTKAAPVVVPSLVESKVSATAALAPGPTTSVIEDLLSSSSKTTPSWPGEPPRPIGKGNDPVSTNLSATNIIKRKQLVKKDMPLVPELSKQGPSVRFVAEPTNATVSDGAPQVIAKASKKQETQAPAIKRTSYTKGWFQHEPIPFDSAGTSAFPAPSSSSGSRPRGSISELQLQFQGILGKSLVSEKKASRLGPGESGGYDALSLLSSRQRAGEKHVTVDSSSSLKALIPEKFAKPSTGTKTSGKREGLAAKKKQPDTPIKGEVKEHKEAKPSKDIYQSDKSKPEKSAKIAKSGTTERSTKLPGNKESKKASRSEKPVKPAKPAKPAKPEKPEKPEKPGEAGKATKSSGNDGSSGSGLSKPKPNKHQTGVDHGSHSTGSHSTDSHESKPTKPTKPKGPKGSQNSTGITPSTPSVEEPPSPSDSANEPTEPQSPVSPSLSATSSESVTPTSPFTPESQLPANLASENVPQRTQFKPENNDSASSAELSNPQAHALFPRPVSTAFSTSESLGSSPTDPTLLQAQPTAVSPQSLPTSGPISSIPAGAASAPTLSQGRLGSDSPASPLSNEPPSQPPIPTPSMDGPRTMPESTPISSAIQPPFYPTSQFPIHSNQLPSLQTAPPSNRPTVDTSFVTHDAYHPKRTPSYQPQPQASPSGKGSSVVPAVGALAAGMAAGFAANHLISSLDSPGNSPVYETTAEHHELSSNTSSASSHGKAHESPDSAGNHFWENEAVQSPHDSEPPYSSLRQPDYENHWDTGSSLSNEEHAGLDQIYNDYNYQSGEESEKSEANEDRSSDDGNHSLDDQEGHYYDTDHGSSQAEDSDSQSHPDDESNLDDTEAMDIESDEQQSEADSVDSSPNEPEQESDDSDNERDVINYDSEDNDQTIEGEFVDGQDEEDESNDDSEGEDGGDSDQDEQPSDNNSEAEFDSDDQEYGSDY